MPHEASAAAIPFRFRPGATGNLWPAVPDPAAGRVAALLIQLDRSQWWSPEELARAQLRQLCLAVDHAARKSPAYGRRLAAVVEPARAGTLTMDQWTAVPLLTRAQIQAQTPRLLASSIPESHGSLRWMRTSGSTGIPLRVPSTEITRLFWDALTLREHLWHQRDLRLKLGVIRFLGDKLERGPQGVRAADWGPPAARLFDTGPTSALHIEHDVGVQLDWLERERPDLLLTYPSNAAELVRQARRRGRALPPLRELRLFSEVVDDDTRALLRDGFGAPVTDVYSANELGYIALQCPEHGRYHLQSENLLIEVLDDDGRACRPGQTGRLVASTLHNFALPLLRYENGDHAQVGEPCPCGRGLPVVTRILGRTRNMVTHPDGHRHWPVVGFARFREVAPVIQHQVLQLSLDEIEVRLVAERAITPDEEAKLAAMVRKALGHDFLIRFAYVRNIERSPVGKYEEFKSLVA